MMSLTKLTLFSAALLGGGVAAYTVPILTGDSTVTETVDLGFAGAYAILSKTGISVRKKKKKSSDDDPASYY